MLPAVTHPRQKTSLVAQMPEDAPRTPQPTAPGTALAWLGRDPDVRRGFVEACLDAERTLGYQVAEGDLGSIRDEVTGPIVDALHAEAGIVRKTLSGGEIFEFPYRSKIAREFVMSEPETPDHVWEPQTTRVLVRLSGSTREAIVGGAYFGDQAIPMAVAMSGSGGRVHAFEPNREERRALERNAELNGLSNLRVDARALWNEAGATLRLSGAIDALASPVVDDDAEASSDGAIETTTIDAYVHAEGIDELGLIMLDLEGGELRALEGAERTLARPSSDAPAVVTEVHGAYTDWSRGLPNAEPIAALLDFGYEAFAIRDFQGNQDLAGRPIELVPVDDIYLDGPVHGFNVLAIKDPHHLDLLGQWELRPGVSPKLLWHKDPALHHPGPVATP